MTTNKSVLNTDSSMVPSMVPRFALVLIVVLSVTMVSVLLIQGLAPPEVSVQAGSLDLVQATQLFTPGESMTIESENVTVFVPRNSVNLTGTISIISREPNIFTVAGATDWIRPQVISVEFWNSKGTPVPGVIFSSAIQICFKTTPEQWEDYTQRPGQYQVQYYAVENNPPVWETLPMRAYSGLSMLCGQVYHLSIFALAVKVESSIPVTGPTLTPAPTSAFVEPTPTRRSGPAIPPTRTLQPVIPPTATNNPPTATPLPPTDTPIPDTPIPDTPIPDTPIPDTPIPDTPIPDTPIPDTPIPDTPIPDTPVPDTPVP